MLALGLWAFAARQPATWVEPPAYEYTVQLSCTMEFPPGQYTLTVADGVVRKAVGDNAQSQEMIRVRKLKPEWFPTLGSLFEDFQQAEDEDADVAEISFDPVDGHPRRIRLDYDNDAIDDEACYDVVTFTAS